MYVRPPFPQVCVYDPLPLRLIGRPLPFCGEHAATGFLARVVCDPADVSDGFPSSVLFSGIISGCVACRNLITQASRLYGSFCSAALFERISCFEKSSFLICSSLFSSFYRNDTPGGRCGELSSGSSQSRGARTLKENKLILPHFSRSTVAPIGRKKEKRVDTFVGIPQVIRGDYIRAQDVALSHFVHAPNERDATRAGKLFLLLSRMLF